jgi:ribosomal 50S subunit-recycling heat shock protein
MVMSEEKVTSQVKKKHKHKKHRRHHFAVLPYILTPIVFVLISLIVVVPVGLHMMNVAIDTVHTAQKTLTIDYNDVKASDNVLDSDGEFVLATKIGKVTCENAGLSTDLYYGINRVSLRNGAAVKSTASDFDNEGAVDIYGYTSTAFKSLKYVEEGDIITVETNNGVYRYEVTDVAIGVKSPESTAKQKIVLASAKSDEAFATFNDEKLYVVGELISQTAKEEVQ